MNETTADIIVVGGGGAALAAAAEAARLGRSILLVEKNARLGGTSALAVGTFMAACSQLQIAAGVEDSPRRHDEELAEIARRLGLRDDPALRRLYVENAGDTVDFLAGIGVDFIAPLPQPPFPTDRLHVALPGGRSYVDRLQRHCRRLGVVIRTATRARRLIREDGRVVGVEVERADGGIETLSARLAVILASGDFSANYAMRAELLGPGAEALPPLNPAATGDGQRMAVEIGAQLALRPGIDAASLGQARFAPPPRRSWIETLPPWRAITIAMKLAMVHLPSALVRRFVLQAAMTALAPERALYEHGAILVNRDGERFADELTAPVTAIAGQKQGEAFVVFDDRIATIFSAWPNFVSTAPGVAYAYLDDYRHARADIFHEAPDVASLAARLGIDAGRLAATLSSAAREAETPAMPPYYALGPLKAWMLLTPIGLAVDTRLQILDAAGEPIPGLYGAGGVGIGGFLSLYHGHSLGWALVSGRLAGRHAAFSL
jgi:succinate dehydrogenase/fumarate reductase flavoprotein subunit